MNNLTITVVIPAYNSLKTIDKALQSVLTQSVKPDQIIVVDDGSVEPIALQLSANYPQVEFIQQQNSGAASARNTGVKHARSDWIAFLDADDFWHEDKLKYQSEAIKAIGVNDVSICTCLTDHSPPSSTYETDISILSDKFIIEHPYLATPTIMINKSTFTQIGGFSTDLATAEDIDLYLKCIGEKKVVRVHKVLTYIVDTPNSLSKNHDTILNELMVYEKLKIKLKDKLELQPSIDGHIQELVENYLYYDINRRNFFAFKDKMSVYHERFSRSAIVKMYIISIAKKMVPFSLVNYLKKAIAKWH